MKCGFINDELACTTSAISNLSQEMKAAPNLLHAVVNLINDMVARPGRPISTSLRHDIRNLHLVHHDVWVLDDGPDEAGAQVPGDVAVEAVTNVSEGCRRILRR